VLFLGKLSNMINFFCEDSISLISSRTRALQIASRIDEARVNPDDVDANQTQIFIKRLPHKSFVEKAKNLYVDVVDNYGLLSHLKFIPSVKIITMSELSAAYLCSILDNDVVVIKQQHCNFELDSRPIDRPVRKVGYCGEAAHFHLDLEEVNDALLAAGFETEWLLDMRGISRDAVCSFYKSIDIHISYRNVSKKFSNTHQVPCMKDPSKLSNSGSFRVPSVCFPEQAYVAEFEDAFIPIVDVGGLVDGCVRLRDDHSLYEAMSNAVYDKSREYEIDRIVPLYEELNNG